MARRIDCPDVDTIQVKRLAIAKTGAQSLRLRHLADRVDTAGLFAQLSEAGDVIGMNVRVHSKFQTQAEFATVAAVFADSDSHHCLNLHTLHSFTGCDHYSRGCGGVGGNSGPKPVWTGDMAVPSGCGAAVR